MAVDGDDGGTSGDGGEGQIQGDDRGLGIESHPAAAHRDRRWLDPPLLCDDDDGDGYDASG